MHGPSILVVNDDTALRDLVELAFSMAGFEVWKARNTEQALELCVEHPPAAALLDLAMEEAEGGSLGRTLRRRFGRSIALVVVGTPAEVEALPELDADAFVPKPFDIDELLRLTSRLTFVAQQPGL
ncbi:MAG: response regulator [Deltaproteobacteria bacterium]|nr:response regulator [Deltaproteobacteria bacterium]